MTDKDAIISIINSNLNICADVYGFRHMPACIGCKYKDMDGDDPCWQHRLADTILKAIPMLDIYKEKP